MAIPLVCCKSIILIPSSRLQPLYCLSYWNSAAGRNRVSRPRLCQKFKRCSGSVYCETGNNWRARTNGGGDESVLGSIGCAIISLPILDVSEIAATLLQQALNGIEQETLFTDDLVRIGQKALAAEKVGQWDQRVMTSPPPWLRNVRQTVFLTSTSAHLNSVVQRRTFDFSALVDIVEGEMQGIRVVANKLNHCSVSTEQSLLLCLSDTVGYVAPTPIHLQYYAHFTHSISQ